MELSFAPMEGVTYAAYRRLHAEMFPGAGVYYAPFIAPDSAGHFKAGNLRDILPENNAGVRVIPQLLCNAAAPFLSVARELAALGYGDAVRAYDALYHAWSRNINNALEFMRIRNHFASINQRLFISSIRDTLTGIYNRQGFAHYADDIFARAKADPEHKKESGYALLEGNHGDNFVSAAIKTRGY